MANLRILEPWFPPLAYQFLRRSLRLIAPSKYRYGFTGDYSNLSEARGTLSGIADYQHENIIKATVDSTRKAATTYRSLSGNLQCSSRDLQVLAGVLFTALRRPNTDRFSVLDFGGGLGSHFFKVRPFLPKDIELNWHIVETEAMVAAGKKHFQDDGLHFDSKLDDVPTRAYDLVFSSGTLQYLDDPEVVLRRLCVTSSPYLMLNRLPLIDGSRHRATIQRTNPSLYRAVYPAWFFGKERFLNVIEECSMSVVMQWDVPEDSPDLDWSTVPYKGMLLARA